MRRSSLVILLSAGTLGLLPLRAQAERLGRTEGNIHIPESSIELREDIGVRSHTNHRFVLRPEGVGTTVVGKVPAQMRAFYGVTGTGSGTIAIIDAYHYKTALNDFNVFARQFGLPQETSTNATASTNKVFQVVYASGSQPSGNASWNQEAALDIEWAHAMAPGAKIILVEAASASNANLYAAVDKAVSLGANQISMSWGGSDASGESASESHFSVSGHLFFASSGDTGGKVIYPSCSQFVVAVGGTSVATDAKGNLTAETAWTSGGGGPSSFIVKPTWQNIAAITGAHRCTPDISSNADPNTGVAVYDSTSYQGYSGWMQFGGTSVSAPCMAGMVNASGLSFGSTTALLSAIYGEYGKTPYSWRDIVSGSNGYSAVAGWDMATGVGAPIGAGSF